MFSVCIISQSIWMRNSIFFILLEIIYHKNITNRQGFSAKINK